MGDDRKELKKSEEIKRSKTFDTVKKETLSEPRRSIGVNAPNIVRKEKKTGKTASEKDFRGMKELKDEASLIPMVMPRKKAFTGKASKSLSKKEQERERERLERESAEAELLQVQDTLETEENDAFGSNPGAVRRRKYAALSRSDKKKRVDEAVKRRKNAREVVAAEMRMGKKPHEIAEIDEKTFKDYLSRFMKLSDEPYKMDTDESFVKNLER